LDRVICCYPLLEPLLKNSLAACNELYGFSVPNDRGLWGIFSRPAFFLEKIVLKLKRCGAYTYLHSTSTMNSLLTQHGFKLVFEKGVGSWMVRIYRTDRLAA
jgi:hypothetical protein